MRPILLELQRIDPNVLQMPSRNAMQRCAVELLMLLVPQEEFPSLQIGPHLAEAPAWREVLNATYEMLNCSFSLFFVVLSILGPREAS